MEHVNLASIIGMIFTLIAAVGLPITLAVITRKKLKAEVITMVVGAGTFLFFALILEKSLFNYLIVAMVGAEKLQSNIWIYAIFAGGEAAFFEEIGRFVSMKFLMKQNLNKQNSIMFGIGHGGIEAILITGFGSISNLLMTALINSGTFETSLESLDVVKREELIAQSEPLWTTAPGMFFLGGVERIAAIALHIALSYFVYRAVKYKKISFLFVAIVFHFLIDACTVVMLKNFPDLVTELFIVVTSAAASFLAFKAYKDETKKAVTIE